MNIDLRTGEPVSDIPDHGPRHYENELKSNMGGYRMIGEY
jgi:hypothetical protein